jgi:hypothetical protein
VPFVSIIKRFNIYGSVHRKYILVNIQQDATLHSFLYLENALHVSVGTSTHHQEHIQLYVDVDTVVCAPDDGWKYHPKHVE